MNNMELWDKTKLPPADAMKAITGGRLKGFTDINPQWRLKALTEHFGPCGSGWKYTVDKLWTVPGSDNQVLAFAQISLFCKHEQGCWCDPIPGIGGSFLIEKEKAGPRTSDEAFKMAVTDALSVACKALGIASDVYEGKVGNASSGSKYDGARSSGKPQAKGPAMPQCPVCKGTDGMKAKFAGADWYCFHCKKSWSIGTKSPAPANKQTPANSGPPMPPFDPNDDIPF